MEAVLKSKIDILINCLNSDEQVFELFYKQAKDLTSQNFGLSRTLFNPIYVSDICLADCPYCGFRVSNKGISRKTLKPDETIEEATFLINRGISNILLLAGDYKHNKYVEMLERNIKAIRELEGIKWLGIEVATLSTDEYKTLLKAGAESVTVFQETYNRQRYTELHQITEYKGDFDTRYFAQERAISAGFKEVGLGVLYGVGFWKDDTIAMALHALEIQNERSEIKFRFSFPRLKLSKGQDKSCQLETITEVQLLRAIVGIRLLFPTASLILTGRETVNFLSANAEIVNILGYDGSTEVAGYNKRGSGLKQFELGLKDDFLAFKRKLNNYVID